MNKKTTLIYCLILISFTSFCQEKWIKKYDEDGAEILTEGNDF
jgi:hypothetical protein